MSSPIRTTDVTGRAFEELRWRTKAIPRFLDERGCLKLSSTELVRVGHRARHLSI